MTKRAAATVIGSIILLALPILLASVNMHWARVIIEVCIWGTVALGFRLILTTGLISLAQVAFMGAGAYTVAILTTRLGMSFWFALPAAGIASATIAIGIGTVSLRAKGIHFALSTLAIAEVMRLVWVEWKSLFGGDGGIINIPAPNSIGTITFSGTVPMCYLALSILIGTVLVMRSIDISRVGKALLTLEKADRLAQSIGLNTIQYKQLAFVIGSGVAGLAGGLSATFYHYTSPSEFSIHQSFYVLIYVLIGGAKNLYWTLSGVIIVMIGVRALHYIPGYNPVAEPLILGLILLGVVKFLPQGVGSVVAVLRAKHLQRPEVNNNWDLK